LSQVDAAAAAAATDLSEKAKALEASQNHSAAEAATAHQQHEERFKKANEKLAGLQKQLQVRTSLLQHPDYRVVLRCSELD
jgi:lipid II:glycine glycyltransferase (peptidoglycan interpeptide bridge formation enzyme)